jgi:hypothetical protein
VNATIKNNLLSGNKTYQTHLVLFPKSLIYGLLFLFFTAGLILIATAPGTGDEGDSVMHYLYARNAYHNPEHFFNHWAKPLYVFLAAPFAQAGMQGMKFFNLICSTGALYLTFRSAGKLGLPNAWLAPFCMAFSPWLMVITLSGLTEPLFAFWMIAGIYLLFCKKVVPGILWLSFLPFVRSEGLIILAVLLVYMLVKKWFRYLPLLLAGHVFYSIAGYFVHKDFLWVFNKMTYATLSSAYGHGPWLHFVHSLPEVTGKVVCALLVLGLIYGFIKSVARFIFQRPHAISNEELFLIYGLFAVYFAGHSAFWALGIFNSFGLLRVLVGVLPLIGLIAARGFNFLAALSNRVFYRWALYALCLLVLAYPFLNDKYSYSWKRDFSLKADQVAELCMADYVRQRFPDYKHHLFYFEACYISVALDINIFDSSKRLPLQHFFDLPGYPHGSFIVWDDWFGPEQGSVTEEQLLGDPRFELIKGFEETDVWNRIRKVRLFRVK